MTSGNRPIKHFYNYVNKKLYIKQGPVRLTDNQDNVVSDTDDAEMLNDYFQKIFTVDNGKLPFFNKQCILYPFNDNINFSADSVHKTISSLTDTHTSGPECLSACLLKRKSTNISIPLSVIFTQAYNGNIPDIWRCAMVTPIYKNSGSKTRVENYRPKV